MDGNAVGVDGGANCSSVLSASPEVTVSSPESSAATPADMMMIHPSAVADHGQSAARTDATAVASSYFADIRKFMGQVTADSLLSAQFQHHHQRLPHGQVATSDHHSDDELSSQDSTGDRNASASSAGPVRLEIVNAS